MTSGETVLVTAAAGGTGQFAVQLAKAAGNHVIGTCGGAAKVTLLKELGVDRVIDYTKESVKAMRWTPCVKCSARCLLPAFARCLLLAAALPSAILLD